MKEKEKISKGRQSTVSIRARKERDKYEVVKMFLHGKSGDQIFNHVKDTTGGTISRQRIQKYINEAIDQWKKDKADMIENHKSIELAKVNDLENEYREAWERSCGDTLNKSTEKRAAADGAEDKKPMTIAKVTELRKKNLGDSKFLDGIQWCVEMRCKLLGLEATQQPDKSTNITAQVVHMQTVVFNARKANDV